MASVAVNRPIHVAGASVGAGTRYLAPLTVLTSLFFMWGFLTCLNDILIPHLKGIFKLSYFGAMLIQFSFFIAYAVMSIPSGLIVKRFGYKRSILIGLGTMSVACLLFYPAASLAAYPIFLAALFVLASGITLLQVAANPFVALLGPPESASSRLTMTQAFNSLGTTVAPLFGSLIILSNTAGSTPAQEAASVQTPYLGLAVTLAALAAVIALFKLPTPAEDAAQAGSKALDDRASAWRYPRLVLGALAIFMYVGGEVAIGSFLVSFFGEHNIAGMAEASAAQYVSFYWGGAMLGRFVGTVTLRRFKPGNVLAVHACAAVACLAIAITLSGSVAMWSILAIGLFNSIMFPTIFTLAIDGLGRHTAQGSGILCTAIVGGALVPLVQGSLADAIGIQHAFIVPVICYAYIAWYGRKAPTLNQR